MNINNVCSIPPDVSSVTFKMPRACLKNHFRNLQAPLCGIFYPHSVAVARYAALIRIKFPTNWDSQFTKSLFQTRSSNELLFATTATVKNIPYDFLRTVSIFPLYRIDKMRIIHQNMIFDIMAYNIVFPFMFPFIIIKIAATIPSDIALNDIAKKIIISFIAKIS